MAEEATILITSERENGIFIYVSCFVENATYKAEDTP